MENAFKHGYHSGLPQFSMQLHVRLVGDSLHLVFTDNGKGMQHLSSKKSGMIGLSTNRQRMEILSAWTGLPAGIEVVNTSSGQISGTSVIIQLPRLASPCRVADYHLFLCKKDEQKFSHSRTDIS
jgi:LytS/YehU family sensor histidine kinase